MTEIDRLMEEIALIIKCAVGRETPNEEYQSKINISDATNRIRALIEEDGWRPPQEPVALQPTPCPLCKGTTQVLKQTKRTMGYTLTEGEDIDEHFIPCPLCQSESTEGELVLNPYECYGCEVEPAEDFHSGEYHAFAEGSEAQLVHDKFKYQELQGICNRLMQDNTELTEKLARKPKEPPSVDELLVMVKKSEEQTFGGTFRVYVQALHEALKAYYEEQP